MISQKEIQFVVFLEQTPFIDLRNKKNGIHIAIGEKFISSQGQDYIQYAIFNEKDFKKVDWKQFNVNQKGDQQIIDSLIKQTREESRLGVAVQNSIRLKNLVLKHSDLIIKYMKKGNPQCALISVRFSFVDARFHIQLKQLMEIAERTKYPLLLVQLFMVLDIYSSQNSDKNLLQKGLQYLQYGIKLGLPEAFVWKGLHYWKRGLGKKAYQMFKNGQKYGFQPVAAKCLGQLFMSSTSDVPKNLRIAYNYFLKAKQLGAEMDQLAVFYLNQIDQQRKKQQKKINSIKSDENTRALKVSNYLQHKIKQYKNPKQIQSMHKFSSTSNICNQQSFLTLCPPKTFFVVFSPVMSFNARHFLAKDINGQLQHISIYN